MLFNKQETSSDNKYSSSWKVFLFEAIIFSITMALGIRGGVRLSSIFERQETITPPSISLGEFALYFLIGTAIIVAASYFLKGGKTKGYFFKTFFFVAVALGALFFFNLWVPSLVALAFVGALLFLMVHQKSLLAHNLTIIFALAGVGIELGLSLTPGIAVIILVAFSIYDYIAVYKTGHMIKMAKDMIKSGAILGILVPQKASGFGAKLSKVEPGGQFMMLGGGDIVFPLILVVSLVPKALIDSIIVAGFSLLGILAVFLMFVFQKEAHKPMPALPPIAFFTILGYVITILV